MTIQKEQRILKNGLRVWVYPRAIGESCAILGIQSGKADDSRAGVSHFLEHLQGVACGVYGNGGELSYGKRNAMTSLDTTAYKFTCLLPGDFPEALQRLLRPLQPPEPTFLERERSAIHEELAIYDHPTRWFHERAFSVLFPKHAALVGSIQEDRKSAAEVTYDDCLSFWKQHYTPDNAILFIGGELPDNLDKLLIPFAELPSSSSSPRPDRSFPEELPLERRIEVRESFRSDPTAEISFQYQAPRFPETAGYKEACSGFFFLGYLDESFGPLYREIRDSRQLCYSVDVDTNRMGNASTFSVSVRTRKIDRLHEIEAAWQGILRDISHGGIPTEILRYCQKRFLINLNHDQKDFGERFVQAEFKHGISIEKVIETVMSVTPMDVAALAQRYCSQHPLVAISLPESSL